MALLAILRNLFGNSLGIFLLTLADDMRIKLMFDLAYAVALEEVWSYLPLEVSILVRTPLVMVNSRGH